VPLIGYKSDVVLYERNERFAGESKYPLKKMLSFAFEGITSFSVKPIRLVLNIGILMFSTSLLFLLYFIVLWLLGKTVAGWATIVVSIWMLGGVQLLCLGVIGEYIGKIYIETKKRPKFIIDKFIKN
ncbi:MAG: glycosyltransferase, partial [Clostridium sp.]|nr:glycosyltransferase [Clostridium sp.]